MSSELITQTNDANFEADVFKASEPFVLVDFWAPWCGPCKSLAPTLDQLAEDFKGKVKIVKVNVDDNPESPTAYAVRGIPALFLFKNGEVVSNKVGAENKTKLTEWLNDHINAA